MAGGMLFLLMMVAGSAMGQPKPAAALPADLNQASMRVKPLWTR